MIQDGKNLTHQRMDLLVDKLLPVICPFRTCEVDYMGFMFDISLIKPEM